MICAHFDLIWHGMRRRVTRKWYSHIFFTMEKIGMKMTIEKPEMNVKRNYLHLFHFRYWQHVTTWDCEKWYISGNTRLCIRDPRNLHLCDFVRCHCHSWWWHKRTHACAHMDLEVHLEYTFLTNNSQEAQYQCKLYDFLQSKSGKQLTSIKKVLLFVSYKDFRLLSTSFPRILNMYG